MNLRIGRRGGCIAGGIGCGLALLILVCVGGILLTVFSVIRSTDVYQDAVAQVRQNEEAVRLLGEPIEIGWLFTGSINTTGSSGDADFSIPVSGPKASGRLYVVAVKSAGVWEYQQLVLEVDGERVPLLTGR